MSAAQSRNLDGKIQLIDERLEFIDLITSLNPSFCDPKLTIERPKGGWFHPWMYFDSLRNYLLMTCFDIIGQPDTFKDFQSWLDSKDLKPERDIVFDSVSREQTLLQAVRNVHLQYLKLYGTRRSFYRFIRDVLSDGLRAKLMYSVKIRRINSIENREIETIDDDTKKAEFLYSVRNAYTHAAKNTGSGGGGMFANVGGFIVLDGKPQAGYVPIRKDYNLERTEHFEYAVRLWPQVLRECVDYGREIVSKRNL